LTTRKFCVILFARGAGTPPNLRTFLSPYPNRPATNNWRSRIGEVELEK